jgi:hypothetical protein
MNNEKLLNEYLDNLFNRRITFNISDIQLLIPELIKKENKSELIQLVNFFIERNRSQDLKDLLTLIEENLGYPLNANIASLVNSYQEAVVFPLRTSTELYGMSGRPKTKMSKILTKGIKEKKNSFIVFNEPSFYLLEPNCFCLNIPIGPLAEPVYIPVIRFGKSNATGYYGATSNSEADFTWYYIEPQSDFLLRSNKTFVARNKIQAFLLLNKDTTYWLYKSALKLIDEYLDKINEYDLDQSEALDLITRNEEIVIKDDYTNFFRKLKRTGGGTSATYKQKDSIFFGVGGMDIFDEDITELARKQGYDVLILTHQSGNSGRLVSELVDTRKRRDSLNNIYGV